MKSAPWGFECFNKGPYNGDGPLCQRGVKPGQSWGIIPADLSRHDGQCRGENCV
jgi:hypothetical protein